MQAIRQLVEKLHLPTQVWAPSGDVEYTNAQFNELFGLPPFYDWASNNLRLCDNPQIVRAGVDQLIRKALEGTPVEVHSIPFDTQGLSESSGEPGRQLMLFLNLVPIKDESRVPRTIVCMVSDYSSHARRFKDELMRSQKMANVETLASGVAHEFNNIFTGIKGIAELIKDEVDSTSEIYEFSQAIQDNISRGSELIQKLSSFAREVPYKLRKTKVSKYVDQLVSLLRLQVTKRVKITMDVTCDHEIMLDSARMDQALTSLALNAKEAMGGEGQILIRARDTSPGEAVSEHAPPGLRYIVIEIADSGPGIPDELLHRVLEPFFTTKERGKATGLGITVANQIVESHHGHIRIGRSEELGGALIQVFLPLPFDT